MKTASVVIGANFGDEGKGLFTDYLAQKAAGAATVVRFNGGSQAGHTVELADGRRHVFSHFGSGSFAGAKTWLSRYFAVNPLTFMREWGELASKGVTPQVAMDPAALVTTPYDMMINQIVEDARGTARHGSCGVGFGETLERAEGSLCTLTVADLTSSELRAKLDRIRTHWVPARLAAHGVTDLPDIWQDRLNSEAILDHYLSCAAQMLDRVVLAGPSYLKSQETVIFEGAQGLLLDQNHDWFPHVTRSNTGLQNVVELAAEVDIDMLDVVYATRSYLTRHGAGPLPFELPEKPYSGVFDATNKPHPYQGTLRFAPLNFDLLKASIAADLQHAAGRVAVKLNVGVSCMDQLDDLAHYVSANCQRSATASSMLDHLMTVLNVSKLLTSYGPTRESISTYSLYSDVFQAI